MLINEVCKHTRLTKKAVEYYTLHGLVSPFVLENGYRDYNKEQMEDLIKISVLRKLDLAIEDIRRILEDTTNMELHRAAVKKELEYQRDSIKKSILQKLSTGKSYMEIKEELQALEQGKTITDKLLETFPGYYGRFVCMHFARFLNEPIQTEEQEAAYDTIISFLDNLPDLKIPEDLEEYLIEGTKHIGTEQISQVLEITKKSYENPDKFLADNKEMLDQYLEYKKSEEYINSPAYRLLEHVKDFYSSTGYYEIFIPAMKQLSPSYQVYYQQMEAANKKLLTQYPEIEKL